MPAGVRIVDLTTGEVRSLEWSTERKLLVAGLVLAALVLGATLLVGRRLTL